MVRPSASSKLPPATIKEEKDLYALLDKKALTASTLKQAKVSEDGQAGQAEGRQAGQGRWTQ